MESKSYLYGVTVKGFKNYDKEQIALQEFEALYALGATPILEIVRPEVSKRPKLEELINTLSKDDYIYMYSIDTLFKGKQNQGLDYYRQILEKGINLVIFDFTGSICKLSGFSNVTMEIGSFSLMRKNRPSDEQVKELAEYCNNRSEGSKLGSFKKKADKVSSIFMAIYFAYEGYEINQEKALSLAKEYCDIQNKRTFWKAAAEFEASYEYYFWLELHLNSDPDFVRFPKRCGGVPEEYFLIKESIEKSNTDLSFEQKLSIAASEWNMYLTPEIYIRWDLAYNKEPKPRNAIARKFKTENLDELRKDALSHAN